MITTYLDASGMWRRRVKGENGEIVGASSEGFSSETACKNNARLLAKLISSSN